MQRFALFNDLFPDGLEPQFSQAKKKHVGQRWQKSGTPWEQIRLTAQ
jgi:hypothetical protein